MMLLRVARATLKADAILVFSWVGEDTAVVREASNASLRSLTLTLPRRAMTHAGGVLMELQAPELVVSTALASKLPFTPAAALALHSVGGRGAPVGGLLAVWESAHGVPERIALEPKWSCDELGRMTRDWLTRKSANDRAELFEHIMHVSLDAIVFLPDDGFHATLNEAAAALLSLPSGRVPAPEVALRLRDFGQRVLNGAVRDAMAATIFRTHADVSNALWEIGGDVPRFFRVSCVNARRGTLRGYIWTFRDVTSEERAVHVLREAEARNRLQHQFLHEVLETIDDAVVASDADGTITLLNSAARAEYGLGGDVTDTSTVVSVLDDTVGAAEDDAQSARHHPLRSALLGNDVTNMAISVERPTGRRELLVSARALRGVEGTITGAVAVERDITARTALEAQIHQSDKLQSLGRMAAAVTHDVNNLLTVIRATTDSLAAGGPAATSFDDDLATLSSAVEGSRALTRSLLEFCRGRVRTPETVNVIAIAARSERLLRRLVSPGVAFEAVIATGQPLYVTGNAAELEQVLFNLCTNANDAMPDGGTLQLAVASVDITAPRQHAARVIPPGTYATISVSDTGYGMSEDVLARIFEPFFTTNRDGGGTGLGLSTVYGIVERSGGQLIVESVVGAGTTFTVYLPAWTDAGEAESRVGTRAHAATHLGDGTQRVLIVDDDPMVLRAVIRMVRQAGFDVQDAASAEEALAKARTGQFDVILSDVQMPVMDGAKLVLALREEGLRTPVVLMSGYALLEHDDMSALTGVGACLTKPFSSDELNRALADALANNDDGVDAKTRSRS